MIGPEPPPAGIDAQSERGKNKENASVGQPISVRIVDQPQSETDEQKDHRKRSHRLQKANFIVGIVTLFILIIYTAINYGLYEATSQSAIATEQAQIAFGSKDGTLVSFGNPIAEGKRVLIIHFFNAGGSTAGHFAVNVGTNVSGNNPWGHRHRWLGPQGDIATEGMGEEVDVGAGAETKVYFSNSKVLKSDKELSDPNTWFNIMGEFEYCDIFGRYTCQSFGAVYRPPPINAFVGGIRLPCIVDASVNAGAFADRGYKEIQPCEQPSEPKYYHRVKVGAAIAASGRVQASVTTQTPKSTDRPTK